jgi:galactose mutarotase-like enzyme
VALEPTTAPCNTLAKAQETNTAVILKPGESFDWEIAFKVREPKGA